jgi:hypothetical protein
VVPRGNKLPECSDVTFSSVRVAWVKGVSMARHDQTRDGGRPREEVDPSKIVRPKDDDSGRHTDRDRGSGGGSDDDRDDHDK